MSLLPHHNCPQGPQKDRVDGLLRVVKRLREQLGVSERSPESDIVASMLAGCAQLIVERSALRRMEGLQGASPEARPGAVPEPIHSGTVFDADPIQPEDEADQGCGIPILWATVNLMMTLTVSVYQRRMGVKNTGKMSSQGTPLFAFLLKYFSN